MTLVRALKTIRDNITDRFHPARAYRVKSDECDAHANSIDYDLAALFKLAIV